MDHELDSGWGACWLKQAPIAALVENALLHFNDERYRLLAWCIMPNPVHAVFEIIDSHSLSNIVGSWKSFTAKQANELLGWTGSFWESD